ncbi:MAG: hypothetical protein CL678_06280 [Bdellovibrionaceae bacterium]|nr:hypothetical protein [Pseudobdellovibrionaceae bacterium]
MARPPGYGGKGTVLKGAGGRGSTAGNSPKYPHPFFDQGQAYLPTSYKNLFHWCRFYFLTNPAVNAAISKLAEYPVTPILFKTENAALRKKYEGIVRMLDLKTFRVEIGLDYFTYGNAFISILFPFKKFLKCSNCGKELSIDDKKTKFKWMSNKYMLDCHKCGHKGFAVPKDHYMRSLREIRLVRWSPEQIDVKYDELTGKSTYLYTIDKKVANNIRMGKKHELTTLPDVFIKAALKNKKVVFSPQNMFHFKRPTLAQKSMGLGMPVLMPVLKDLHYLGILRRSQEAIAQEHIVPLRIMFPQQNGTMDPYSSINLTEWRKEITKQLSAWKIDPNRIPIMPMPVGTQTIGGQGRALILHQEYRVWSEHIIAGMGVPPEFVFGGMQYSGTNLTMFQLHNKFLSYIEDLKDLVFNFILDRIAAYMGYPAIEGDFRPFKMADDLQRTMLYFQLVQAQKLADRTLLEDLGFDPQIERLKIDAERGEQLELQKRMQQQQAHMQGEIMQINTRYQLATQKVQAQGQIELQKMQQAAQEEMQREAIRKQQAAQVPMLNQASPANGILPQSALTGSQVAPGFPEGATAYSRGGDRPPMTGVPPWIRGSDYSRQGSSQMDISYVAKRAAAFIQKLPQDRQTQVLQNMQTANPSLFAIVQQILLARKGQQANSLNPAQMPLPEQKPQRRDPSRRIGG